MQVLDLTILSILYDRCIVYVSNINTCMHFKNGKYKYVESRYSKNIYNGTQHLNSFNSLLYLYGCSLQNREYKNIYNLHWMCMCVEESKHS